MVSHQQSVSKITLEQSQATAAAAATLFMNSRGDRNCVLDGGSALISCSNTALDTSSTTTIHSELPLGAAAMYSVSTPPVAMAKLAPMSVSVGALGVILGSIGLAAGTTSVAASSLVNRLQATELLRDE